MERILIPQPIARIGVDYLENNGYEVVNGTGLDEDTIAREIAGCAGLLVRNQAVTRRIIDAADKLRVIGRHGVGTDNIDVKYANGKGIIVTNAPLSNANAVAEHTMFLMLTCANRCRMIHDGLYREPIGYEVRNRAIKIELSGKTLGVVGLGRIGRSVAQKAHFGFGMNIVGYNRSRRDDLPDYIEFEPDLDKLLARCDFVSLHVMAVPETRRMIDARALSLMKKSACLINTARGSVVDEAALIEALRDGVIAGAALDVLNEEPFLPSHPLMQMPNVFVSPHNAAHTKEAFDNMALHAAQGIHEVLSGQTPTWPVCR